MEERLSPFFEQLDSVYRQGFPEAVEAFLQESLCRAEGETDRELELAVWNELGSFFRGTGRYEESLSAFQRAEDLAGELRGRDSGGYATVLNNMAGTCRLLHRASEAESLFLRAMECYQQAGLEGSDAYTSVLNNLSLVYRETGELEKAIDYLLRALKRLEGRGDRRAELAVTYNNLTTLYQAAGDRDKALLCVNRALQEYEKCPEEQRAHYAAVLNSLAGFLCGQGDLRRALALYRQSAQYTRRFFGENEEYGITCQNMRWVYERLGDREGAVAALERAEAVYTRLFGAESDRARAVAEDLRRLRAEAAL